MTNRSLLAAALLAIAARAGRGAGAAAADTQPAPTVQQQAAPQTGPNTPPADSAQPPARGYDECMVVARGAAEHEREAAERACAALPDAPK